MVETTASSEQRLFTNPEITRRRAPGLKRVPTPKAQLYIWNGFMTAEECARIIDIARPHLRRSQTASQHDLPTSFFRTSATCDLSFVDDPFVAELDQKIAEAVGAPVEHGEGIQAQCYQVGQEFKPHTDYFKAEHGEIERHCGEQGQRTWTFMVFLNNEEAGGHTHFVEIDRRVKPRLGRAVAWNNLDAKGEPNLATMHHGMKVEAGEKFIITKWFRERPQPA